MIYADGVFSDITEYKTAQEMMIQSEKMMSIGGLAAGIAHEINNPLAGIIQYVQVIRQRFSGGLKKNKDIAAECGTVMESITAYAERRGLFKMMESIAESEQRAARIVQSILNFSRKNEITFASYDLRDLLDDTVFLAGNDYDLKKKYDFKNIKIHANMMMTYQKWNAMQLKFSRFFSILSKTVFRQWFHPDRELQLSRAPDHPVLSFV